MFSPIRSGNEGYDLGREASRNKFVQKSSRKLWRSLDPPYKIYYWSRAEMGAAQTKAQFALWVFRSRYFISKQMRQICW